MTTKNRYELTAAAAYRVWQKLTYIDPEADHFAQIPSVRKLRKLLKNEGYGFYAVEKWAKWLYRHATDEDQQRKPVDPRDALRVFLLLTEDLLHVERKAHDLVKAQDKAEFLSRAIRESAGLTY